MSLDKLASVADDLRKQIAEESIETPSEEVLEETLEDENLEEGADEDVGEDSEEGDEEPDLGDEAEEEEDPEELDAKGKKRFFYKQRQELTEEKDLRKQLEERLRQIELAQAEQKGAASVQPVVDADPEPDKDFDPDAWNSWKISQQEQQIQSNNQAMQDLRRNQDEQEAWREIDVIEKNFRAQNSEKNYDGAIEFLSNQERSIIKLQHPNATPAQIEKYISGEKMRIFSEAVAADQDPADLIYKMASAKGYKEEVAKPKTKKDFSKVKENMRKNKSLIGGTSAADGSNMHTSHDIFNKSIKDMAALSDDERKKMFSAAHKNLE